MKEDAKSVAHVLKIVAPDLHHSLSLGQKLSFVIRSAHPILLDMGQLTFDCQWSESVFVRPRAKCTSGAVCPEQSLVVESSTD
jgi:hypothetical protein